MLLPIDCSLKPRLISQINSLICYNSVSKLKLKLHFIHQYIHGNIQREIRNIQREIHFLSCVFACLSMTPDTAKKSLYLLSFRF